MRKILCFFGIHDWRYNSLDIVMPLGSERTCQCCGIKEFYAINAATGNYLWYRTR